MITLLMKYRLKLFKNVSESDSGIENIYNSYYKVFKSTYIMLGYWPTQSTKLRVIMFTYHVTVSALLLNGQVRVHNLFCVYFEKMLRSILLTYIVSGIVSVPKPSRL